MSEIMELDEISIVVKVKGLRWKKGVIIAIISALVLAGCKLYFMMHGS